MGDWEWMYSEKPKSSRTKAFEDAIDANYREAQRAKAKLKIAMEALEKISGYSSPDLPNQWDIAKEALEAIRNYKEEV